MLCMFIVGFLFRFLRGHVEAFVLIMRFGVLLSPLEGGVPDFGCRVTLSHGLGEGPLSLLQGFLKLWRDLFTCRLGLQVRFVRLSTLN